MRHDSPQPKYLRDYRPTEYTIPKISLTFELGEESTLVTTQLQVISRNEHDSGACPLTLDGADLELVSISIDDTALNEKQYEVGPESLTILEPPKEFCLQIVTRIKPQENTSLEGLYKSNGVFCTQCEAEGFRKITYFLDRPDVMSKYRVKIIADREKYPVLLSNGNRLNRGTMPDGRHCATWEDPFPKPCYLFALVAGDLGRVSSEFVTGSGRPIKLEIYTEHHNVDKCDHAMESLKKSMRWDEEVYGLEYDLDRYMIVAVEDFNMGAMENKGLNVFNTKYILAKPETATDADYAGIEGVVAHEYFHNWTGNRVTCRDWFQLSLKEGLTVFRDQEFSSDMGSRAVVRIDEVRLLRNHQFPEDAGPMAHPVRPQSYIEMNNFYTVTVYNKGAEVIRMYETLLSPEGFQQGMQLYFDRHDGQAVTTDDFAAAMAEANGYDLDRFKRWYDQAGTPVIDAEGHYDAEAKTYTLTLRQNTPDTPGQSDKSPFHIPVRIGLLDSEGQDLPLSLNGDGSSDSTRVLSLTEAEQQFVFDNIAEKPVPSLLRNFSAPVRLNMAYSDEELAFLMAKDSDDFNRWEAGQTLASRNILELVEKRARGEDLSLPETFSQAFGQLLTDVEADPALIALAIILPSETYIAESMEIIDVDGIHQAREFMRRSLAQTHRATLEMIYEVSEVMGPYEYHAEAAGKRALRAAALAYLMELDDDGIREACLTQFREANNMTERMAAMQALVSCDCPQRDTALAQFYEDWQNEALVVDKWFTLQAQSSLPGTVEAVQALLAHPAFNIKNPNRARSLIGAFAAGNPAQFHRADGAGYRFLADRILELDSLNPQIAARMSGNFTRWKRYDNSRQALMKTELERILAKEDLSPDVYEIVSKSLA